MTQRQVVLIVGGVVVLAALLYFGKQTYPRWGARLRQSEGRE